MKGCCGSCIHFKRQDVDGGYCKNTVGNKSVKQSFSCPMFGLTGQPSAIPKPLPPRIQKMKERVEAIQQPVQQPVQQPKVHDESEHVPQSQVLFQESGQSRKAFLYGDDNQKKPAPIVSEEKELECGKFNRNFGQGKM